MSPLLCRQTPTAPPPPTAALPSHLASHLSSVCLKQLTGSTTVFGERGSITSTPYMEFPHVPRRTYACLAIPRASGSPKRTWSWTEVEAPTKANGDQVPASFARNLVAVFCCGP